MTAAFSIEVLSGEHDRGSFECGVEPLDRYFKTQVTQDIRRRVAGCFVAVERGTKFVAGYYTIAATSIPLPDISADIVKKLPRYPLVPAARIGRLAVAAKHRGRGLGAALLVDGMTRTFRAEVMAYALVVDAKDDEAVAFYQHLGFLRFASQPMTLFLPLTNAVQRFGIV